MINKNQGKRAVYSYEKPALNAAEFNSEAGFAASITSFGVGLTSMGNVSGAW